MTRPIPIIFKLATISSAIIFGAVLFCVVSIYHFCYIFLGKDAFLFLFHPDELGGVVAAALGFGEDGVEGLLGQFGGAGEYPEIFGAAAADKCPLVVGVEQHHAVVAVERSEEGDAQHGRRVGGLGLAV